ncbi:MAG: zinc-binding dehydrogenase [Solirubrobacteraceae bacterium]
MAAILRDPSKPLSVERLELPPLNPGQVLVEIAYSGLCGSQLLEARGLRGEDRWLPHTLGHEASGTVLETGAGVSKVSEGDCVVVTWIKGSGADVPSTRYPAAGEFVNSGALSTFMEHAIVSENRLVAIPAQVPMREAALLGCAVPTGVGMVENDAGVTPGSSVGLFGVGGVGLSAVLGARLAGAGTIVAVDIHQSRLERAIAAGATATLNAMDGDVAEAVRELTGGRGLDFAIECSGARPAMEAAYAAARHDGGTVVLAGNLPAGGRIEIDPFDLIRGKRIVGSWGGASDPDRDVRRFCEAILEGALDLSPLIGAEFPLGRADEALRELELGTPGRPLLKLR